MGLNATIILQSATLNIHHKRIHSVYQCVVCRYWSFDQMIAHHTIGGCNLRPGDLLASGTISGDGPMEFGSLLEKTWGGTKNFELAPDDSCARGYLQDGDTVILQGHCLGVNGGRVGFGDCSGSLLPCHC